jgi:hypothetical protein
MVFLAPSTPAPAGRKPRRGTLALLARRKDVDLTCNARDFLFAPNDTTRLLYP